MGLAELKQGVERVKAREALSGGGQGLLESEQTTHGLVEELKDGEVLTDMAVDEVASGERARLICDQIKEVQSQIVERLKPVLVLNPEIQSPPGDHSELIGSLISILQMAIETRDRIDI